MPMRRATLSFALLLGVAGCPSDDTSAGDTSSGSTSTTGTTGTSSDASSSGESSTSSAPGSSTTEDGSSTGDPGQLDYDPVLLDCAPGSSFPFTTESTGFTNPDAEAIAGANPRIKDMAADLLGNPGGPFAYTTLENEDAVGPTVTFEGLKARTTNDAGLDLQALSAEAVSLWRYDGTEWAQADRQTSDKDGAYTFADAPTSNNNRQPMYAVLEADQSCAPHYTWLLDSGTPVIITDIDGTLTLSDQELLTQISDGMYDPVRMGSAVELMQAWASKGYDIVYITARPHTLRAETRAWLDLHGFPVGPLITSNSLAFGTTAEEYKAAWGRRMLDDFGWQPIAAYGNAETDIAAYDAAGIPKEITFVVGEFAGTEGTMPIADEDYAAHIADFVTPYPDAP